MFSDAIATNSPDGEIAAGRKITAPVEAGLSADRIKYLEVLAVDIFGSRRSQGDDRPNTFVYVFQAGHLGTVKSNNMRRPSADDRLP